jgi:hypothetical protein
VIAPWWLLKSSDDRLPTDANWNELRPLLRAHSLEGFVYSRWRGKLNEKLERPLRAVWQCQWLENLRYLDEARTLQQRGRETGIAFVLLKGLALADRIYPDLGARCLSDMDLLVGDGSWNEAQRLVRAHGYRELSGVPPEYRAYKITYVRGLPDGTEVLLDLHRKLLFGEPEDFKWAREGDRLSLTDLVAYLAGHFGYQHGFHGLNWLLDLALVIENWANPDWERLEFLCDRLGLHESLGLTVETLRRFLGTKIPARLDALILRRPPLRRKLCASALSEDYLWYPEQHRLRYFLVQNLVKDSWSEALAHDWLWLRRRIPWNKRRSLLSPPS